MSLVTAALAGLLTLGTPTARAQEDDAFVARWDTPYTPRAPRRGTAAVAWHGVFGDGTLSFLDAEAALPFAVSPKGRFVFGMVVDVGTTLVTGPPSTEPSYRLRHLSTDLWFLFHGPRRRTHHGFGVRMDTTAGDPSSYRWLDAREAGFYGSLFYESYVITRPIDIAVRGDLGGGAPHILHAGMSLSLLGKPIPQLAVGGGFGMDLRGVTAAVSLRGRPAPGVELLLDVHLPLTGLGEGLGSAPVWPSLGVRVWDARPGAQAAAPWSPALRAPRAETP
ncbi:MAG: hypothetical protein H6732_00070 [Alphaproteobacteria bacterium]|nr:hypothetical protein [Alphaproteobacteria bacterium]